MFIAYFIKSLPLLYHMYYTLTISADLPHFDLSIDTSSRKHSTRGTPLHITNLAVVSFLQS